MHVRAKKSLGQNFLQDERALHRIAELSMTRPNGLLVEIGPGTGMLTKHLLEMHPGAIIAFELDERLITPLRIEFGSSLQRLEIVQGDFLAADLEALYQRSGGELVVAGNIPYYITSEILFKLLDARRLVRRAVMLVQKEVAERITASPRTKAYGIPTILTNFFAEATYEFTVPREHFRPKPNVDSAVISINFERDYFSRNSIARPEGFGDAAFRKLVRALFAMRRKTLRNNLKPIASPEQLEYIDSHIPGFLGRRAEELTIEEILRLFEILQLRLPGVTAE